MRDGWVTTTLGEIAETRLGKTLPRGSGADASGAPYLRNVNVQWGRLSGLDSLNMMVFSRAEQEQLSLLAGDILACEGGEVGRLTLLREDMPGVFFQNALHRIRVTDPVASSAFVALALEHFIRAGGLEGLVSQVTIAHLNQSKLRALPVTLPPLDEQRRIVDLIGAVDDAIGAAEKAAEVGNMAYEQMLRSLVSKFENVPLSSVVRAAFAGGTPSRKNPEFFTGSIPWLKSGEVESDSILDAQEHITEAALQASSARLVSPGSTLVAMYGQGDTKGRAGFVSAEITTNQAVLALVPDSNVIDEKFLLHAVRSRTASLRSRAVGAAQPNLSKALVVSEPIPVPTGLDVQQTWTAALDSVRTAVSEVLRQAARLRALRSNLLTALLAGDHEIPESYDELLGPVN